MSDSEAVSVILETIHFAAQVHSDHKRKGDSKEPYINHPVEVAFLLSSVGEVKSMAVLQAALLHDTIEESGNLDQRKKVEKKIKDTFGSIVFEIVREVTDPLGPSREERKELQIKTVPSMTWQAKLIKLADKTCNITDMLEKPPSGWSLLRKIEYLDSAEKVVNGLRGVNPELEALFDKKLIKARTELTEN